MSVAKIIELVGCSDKSFDDAIKQAINTARKTVRGITGADVKGMTIKIRDDKLEYRANVKISFQVEKKE